MQDFIAADINEERKKTKLRKQKEPIMKKENKAPKIQAAPKTIKVSTLVKAAVIVAAIVASFIAGVHASNAYDSMIDSEAEARAASLLKTNSNQ